MFRARVESLAPAKFRATAQGMEGAALIRVGKGFFRNTAWMPTLSLGMAIRFYDPQAGGPPTTPRANDFDLLVVSWAERFNHLLWRTPFQTDTGDFFGNEYYPAIPYRVEGEEVWVRVVPAEVESKGPSPLGKLLAATEAGDCVGPNGTTSSSVPEIWMKSVGRVGVQPSTFVPAIDAAPRSRVAPSQR